MDNITKGRILVVDDDPRYVRLIQVNLEASGYAVLVAHNGEEAVISTASAAPDLVLLDIMMPNMNGYTACKKIREFTNVPIVMLTALGETEDKVKGLDMGADDYITKPISVQELLARVRAALRRVKMAQPEHHPTFQVGEMFVDFTARRVFIQDKEVNLTPTEYRLLYELVTQAERVLTTPQLLEKLWGPGYEKDTHLVWQAVHRLRQKIEADPDNPQYIHTRPGIGYILSFDENNNG